MRNRFTNPATGETYDWHVNHSEEQEFGKARSVDHTALTSNVGVVRQQGEDEPMVLDLQGTILHAAQHAAMVHFYGLSRDQSILFRDFHGDEYEVIITSFKPVRKRTLRNPKDPSIPLHYWTYSIQMEVLRFVSGAWLGVPA